MEMLTDTASHFDAAMLMALATERAGTVGDRVAIRDGLWAVSGTGADHREMTPSDYSLALTYVREGYDIHYTGASGDLVFDGYGDVARDTLILQMVDGEFVDVEVFSHEDARELNAREATICPETRVYTLN